MNDQEKDPSLVGAVFRPHYGCLPVKQIFSDRACRAVGWRVMNQVQELFLDTLKSHGLHDVMGLTSS